MSFIRTILGDIEPSALGVCYSHEHIVINQSYTTEQNPDFLLNESDEITRELSGLYNAGVRSMIDTMPGGGAGHDVRLLAQISRNSKIQIVCPTGVHLSKYYPPGHWSTRIGSHELLEAFVGEINLGIDINDLAGPATSRSQHKAGLIKIATGPDGMTDRAKEIFLAAAEAHLITGCPILTHTEQGAGAMEQIEMLTSRGADLSHVVLSHLDRNPDAAYHRKVLKTGVKIEYDSAFRWKTPQRNFTLDLLLELLPEFPHQILLGMDAARTTYWKSFNGAPGLIFLMRDFIPQLRGAGISQQLIDNLFIHNPANTFQFSTREPA